MGTHDGVRWAAEHANEVTTTVDVRGRDATVVEIGDGVVRVRMGVVVPGGFELDQDITLFGRRSLDAGPEQLPLLFDDSDCDDDSGIHLIPGPVRALPRCDDDCDAGFGSSSEAA